MSRRFNGVDDLPGQRPVAWRRSGAAIPLAVIAGVAFPPILLTLPVWPPESWLPGLDMDWRLFALFAGLLAVPAGVWALRRERERHGRPATRLGVVWRFTLFGGLLAGALMALLGLGVAITGAVRSADIGQAAGFSETALLIYGVLGLPVAIVGGVAYAMWAGLCVAFIAFADRPVVRDRLGLMARDDDAAD